MLCILMLISTTSTFWNPFLLRLIKCTNYISPGHSQSEVEPLSRDMVNNLREQLKISSEYFSMLVVGKDSDVKAWFPSPMWSLDSIYDLVDSMDLRLQEEKLQQRLGIHCPEDRGTGGREGGHYPGYDEDRADDAYLYHRSEEWGKRRKKSCSGVRMSSKDSWDDTSKNIIKHKPKKKTHLQDSHLQRLTIIRYIFDCLKISLQIVLF